MKLLQFNKEENSKTHQTAQPKPPVQQPEEKEGQLCWRYHTHDMQKEGKSHFSFKWHSWFQL